MKAMILNGMRPGDQLTAAAQRTRSWRFEALKNGVLWKSRDQVWEGRQVVAGIALYEHPLLQ